ncbi:thioredoxin family protein [Desulfogranum mediterraneum]|uniref:thioredoxin family protein n=1 Tax=Desulfogranum mediterraneum TaxID=160661 RepID=UPI00048F08BB|nr:thioredoxin family protein [Desulfogranum mediterraneum]
MESGPADGPFSVENTSYHEHYAIPGKATVLGYLAPTLIEIIMHIHFFKSFLCPRCRRTERLLREISRDHPEITIQAVDLLSHPLLALRHRVLMIPTLVSEDNRRLSGWLPDRTQLLEFVGQGAEGEPAEGDQKKPTASDPRFAPAEKAD